MECGYRQSQLAPPLIASTALGLDGKLAPAPFPQSVRKTVHIDSRDRDYDKYPSGSQFAVALPETIQNVTSAVLVSAELPLSYYVFSAARGNTTLKATLNGTTKSVTVPDGNYGPTTMAAALKTALQSAFSPATFNVGFDTSTMKCTISATSSPSGTLSVDTTDAVKKTEWGLGYYLGFPRATVTSGTGAVTGTSVASMNPENYLLIEIEELNGIRQAAMYATGGSGRTSFAKVPLNGDSYTYNYYDKTLTYVDLRPQLNRIDRLNISIRFHDGTLVDLNGGEWSMSLEFACTLTRGL